MTLSREWVISRTFLIAAMCGVLGACSATSDAVPVSTTTGPPATQPPATAPETTPTPTTTPTPSPTATPIDAGDLTEQEVTEIEQALDELDLLIGEVDTQLGGI
jgi:hypothetical protein